MKFNLTFDTFPVRQQFEPGFTHASVVERATGTEQAEVLTAVLPAGRGQLRLQGRMVHVDGERLRDQVRHHGLVRTLELVRREHSVQLPVRPVQRVLEQRQRVRVQQVVAAGQDLLPLRPVVLTEVDEIQFGISEIHSLSGRVQGQTVRPVDLGGDDGGALCPVHADPLDARILSPVGPEQPLRVRSRVQAHSSGLRDVPAHQGGAHRPVLFGHLYGVQFAVQPVDVTSDPIVSQAFYQVQPCSYDVLGLAASV